MQGIGQEGGVYEATTGRKRSNPRLSVSKQEWDRLHPEEAAELAKYRGLGSNQPLKQVQFDIYKTNANTVADGMEWAHGGPAVKNNARSGNGKPTVVANSNDFQMHMEEGHHFTNRRDEGKFSAQEMAEARRVRARRSNASDPNMLGFDRNAEWENKRHRPAPQILGARPEASQVFNQSTSARYCMEVEAPVFFDSRNVPAPRLVPRPNPSFQNNKHNMNIGDDQEYMSGKRYETSARMPEHKDLSRPEPARYRLDDDVPLGRNTEGDRRTLQRGEGMGTMPQHSFETYSAKPARTRRAHDEPTSLW